MPKQKDLKRVVRSRMQKTGESYTAARANLVRRREPETDYAARAGIAEERLVERTGRDWREWVRLLDAANLAAKPHRDIARHVASLGTPAWWSQTVAVGYERIKGVRDIGQRHDGGFAASKSKTFPVPVQRLYGAFATAPRRQGWLDRKVTVRSSVRNKTVRLELPDASVAQVFFASKGPSKSTVTIEHTKLADRTAVGGAKTWWTERLDALADAMDR